MLHDPELLDRLAAYPPVRFDGHVFRATRRGLDPLVASINGGRWMVPGLHSTLYTSCERDGAVAEIVHHWSQLTPIPSKPAMLHTLAVRVGKTLRLGQTELVNLGVEWSSYNTNNPRRTQEIGAAVAHLDLDGLIAPSARWTCSNVILFVTNHDEEDSLVVRESVEVDWRKWMLDHALD
jgi:RES domain-containing protein